MALIKQSDLEAKLGRTLTDDESNAFTVVNTALQTQIERTIGSSVESASEDTRYYDGGVQHLAIDPCTDITAVEQVDDDGVVVYVYDTTDYNIDPRNRTLKTMLRHRNGAFMRGISNIAVTAKFSVYDDSETLAVVKNALLEALTAELEDADNLIKESIEGYSVEYAKTQTKDALANIRYLFPEV